MKSRWSIWNVLLALLGAWCLCYKLTKYCNREVSRLVLWEFRRSGPLGRQFVLVCGFMCSITTVPSWVDITFSCIIQKADRQRRKHCSHWKAFPLSPCTFLAVFIQTCSAGEPTYVSAADMSPALNSVCRKRENKWAQNAWMTCIPPGESQLKLFLQVLETFSGIDMLTWSWSVGRLTTWRWRTGHRSVTGSSYSGPKEKMFSVIIIMLSSNMTYKPSTQQRFKSKIFHTS